MFTFETAGADCNTASCRFGCGIETGACSVATTGAFNGDSDKSAATLIEAAALACSLMQPSIRRPTSSRTLVATTAMNVLLKRSRRRRSWSTWKQDGTWNGFVAFITYLHSAALKQSPCQADLESPCQFIEGLQARNSASFCEADCPISGRNVAAAGSKPRFTLQSPVA